MIGFPGFCRKVIVNVIVRIKIYDFTIKMCLDGKFILFSVAKNYFIIVDLLVAEVRLAIGISGKCSWIYLSNR
jgi:hypothetical protein